MKKSPAPPAPPKLRADVAVVSLNAVPDLPADVASVSLTSTRRSASYNAGLSQTAGRYVVLLDGGSADLDAAVRALDAAPDVGVLGAGTEERDVESVDGSALVVRRSLVDVIGRFDEGLTRCFDDVDFCERARVAGFRVRTHPALKAAPKPVGTLEHARCWARWARRRGGLLAHPLRLVLSWFARSPASNRFLQLRDGWHVREEHLEGFSDFDRAVDKGKTVKEAKYKRTLEVAAGGKTYLVKLEGKGRWFRTVRHFFLGSKAKREARISSQVLATGIPCVPVVAWGDRSYGAAAVTEKLAGARSVHDALADPSLPPVERRRLLRDYGRFARRLHDAGVAQYDFSPVNLLLHEGRIRLIDFEWTTCKDRPISEPERLRALAKISRYGLPSRADQVRFLHGYTDAHPLEKARIPAIFGLLRAAAARTLEADVARAAERCVEENRDYARFEIDGFEGHYRKSREGRADAGLDLDAVKTLLGKGGDEVPDAIDAWKKANQAARRGGAPRPLAVARRRGETPGRLYWSRNVQAPGGVEQV